MADRSGIITLTTDFGTRDPFVGIVKGVILGIFPAARIVDLTHQVPPQNIEAAAWVIQDSYRYFPPGTVHMAVVDPGVGSDRRALAMKADGHFFVGPDNGLFSPLLDQAETVIALCREELFRDEVSATFHARDVFAPVAAGLAKGLNLEETGDRISDPVRIELPRAVAEEGVIRGRVVEIDLFGNLITNVPAEMIPKGRVLVMVGNNDVMGIGYSYASLSNTAPGAIIGSHGRLEIALKNGNAAEYLGAGAGEKVELTVL
jgi:S-adenosyl-L-methionine hydrolase (adenosine-forming)